MLFEHSKLAELTQSLGKDHLNGIDGNNSHGGKYLIFKVKCPFKACVELNGFFLCVCVIVGA